MEIDPEPSSKTQQNNLRNEPMEIASVSPSQELVTKTSVTSILESNGNGTLKIQSLASLPPEMIGKVLANLNTLSLVNCRLVNRQWCDISSQIIRNRDDVTMHFKLFRGKFIQRIPRRNPEKLLLIERKTSTRGSKNLGDLVTCLQENFPFTSYRFDAISDLRNEDMRNFLTIWGEKIRTLKVSLRKSANCGEVLRELMFEKATKVKKMQIKCWSDYRTISEPQSILLLAEQQQWQLPELEVLCVDHFYRKHPKIIEDILTVARKLKELSFEGFDITAQLLQMLESTKTLQCLKNMELDVNEELIQHWKMSPKCLDLQLKSLSLSLCDGIYADYQLMLSATEIINKLFHSSKSVLESFITRSLGSLTGLVFPKFEKLHNLSMHVYSHHWPIFPPSIDWLDAFPNVKELDVEFWFYWPGALSTQSPILPNVDTLRVLCNTKAVLIETMKMTPNLKTLIVEDEMDFWIHARDNAKFDDISRYAPKIENFGLRVRRPENHLMHKMDALITGLPGKLCKKLAVKFRDMDRLSAGKISAYQRKRIHPSIFYLKQLRHLELDFYCFDEDYPEIDDYSWEDNESEWSDSAGLAPIGHLYDTGVTKVSKFLGFDLLPNLEVFIHRHFQ